MEEYCKPAEEALKKAQAAQAEPPKKKHFTFRYWINTKDAKTEGNEFIKYATGAPIELEDTDITFNPIEWCHVNRCHTWDHAGTFHVSHR
jgi:hypothetical protein